MKKLHLGCGQIILAGWDNLDLNPAKGGIKCDLRKKLPYQNNSVDVIFCEHFIEHITREEGVALFRECKRVLKTDGVLRVVTPDLKVVANDYLSGKTDRAKEVWHPDTPCQMMNGAMRLWEHRFLYDFAEMELVLKEAGFDAKAVLRMNYKKSVHEALQGIDQRPHHEELIVEVAK